MQDVEGFLFGLFVLVAVMAGGSAATVAWRRPLFFAGSRGRRVLFVVVPMVLWPAALAFALVAADDLQRSGPQYGAKLGLVAAAVARLTALTVRRHVRWLLSPFSFTVGIGCAIAAQSSSIVAGRTWPLYLAVVCAPPLVVGAIARLATDAAQIERFRHRLGEAAILVVLTVVIGQLVPPLVARRQRYEREKPLREAFAAAKESNVLDLSQHHLVAVPDEIGELTALKKLDLTGCDLVALPVALSKLPQLEELDLTRNQLKDLDGELRRLATLPNLHVLRLGDNRLTVLPPSIGGLVHLTELDLSHNQLTALPAELGALSALRVLRLGNDFDGNRLATLPDVVLALPALELLDLSHNRLTALPPTVATLAGHLRELRVAGNPLPDLGAVRSALPRTRVLPE